MNLVYVCGTARSGTSAVAQLIERMGATTLPKTVAGAYNPDYQENMVVNALTTAIHPWHKLATPNADIQYMNGFASYLAEHAQQGKPLVAKSPGFPFILAELDHIARILGQLLGEPVHPHYVCTTRDTKAQVQSLQAFTMGCWSDAHWHRVIEAGRVFMVNNIERSNRTWISYGTLLEDWQMVAHVLTDIPGLTVPEDGGINPELNHHTEADNAA